jgi:hypothetical protein
MYALHLSRDLPYIVGVAPINSTLCNTFHQVEDDQTKYRLQIETELFSLNNHCQPYWPPTRAYRRYANRDPYYPPLNEYSSRCYVRILFLFKNLTLTFIGKSILSPDYIAHMTSNVTFFRLWGLTAYGLGMAPLTCQCFYPPLSHRTPSNFAKFKTVISHSVI